MALRVTLLRSALLMALILTTALLAACGGGEPNSDREPRPRPFGDPVGPVVTETIGRDGGTVTSADGKLTLTVPDGALASDTPIGVQELTNTSVHGRGSAYRLTPHGLKFDVPVTIEFATALSPHTGGLLVGFQDPNGFWQGVLDSRIDQESGAVSARIGSFSDWTLFEALRVDPPTNEVRTGESVQLTVLSCLRISEDDLLAPLLPTCAPLSLVPLLRAPAAYGVAGGNAQVGEVTLTEGQPRLTYRAPADAPTNNPVAVSVEVRLPGDGRHLLVADVLVQDEPCMDPWPGSCAFDLVSVAGEGLPYGELPRDNEHDNPEYVIAGRLILDDFDGDGSGSYTLRVTIREDRAGDVPLEVVIGDAGDFETGPGGSAGFTSLTGGELSGVIGGSAVLIERFPIWGTHSHLVADLEFNR